MCPARYLGCIEVGLFLKRRPPLMVFQNRRAWAGGRVPPVSLAWLRLRRTILFLFLAVTPSLSFAGPEEVAEIVRLRKRCEELVVDSKYVELGPVSQKLYALAREEYGERHQMTIEAMHFVAFLAHIHGDLATARQGWTKSLEIQESLPSRDPLWYSRTLSMLGSICLSEFEFGRAEEFLLRALKVREDSLGSRHPETGSVVRDLAYLHQAAGDYARAETMFRHATEIFQEAGHDYQVVLAETSLSLAWLYLDIRDETQALEWMRRVQALGEGLPERHRTAYLLNSLQAMAEAQKAMGHLEEARATYLRGLALAEEVRGRDNLGDCHWLLRLAQIERELGSLEMAAERAAKALRIQQEILGKDHPRLADAWSILGWISASQGELSAARSQFESAYAINRKHRPVNHPSVLDSLRNLARFDLLMGRPETALEAVEAIQDGEEQRLASLFSFTSERQKLAYQERHLVGASVDLWGTIGAAGPMARALLRLKAVVLDSLIEDELVAQMSGDPAVDALIKELAEARKNLAAASLDAWARVDDSVETMRRKDVRLRELGERVEAIEVRLASAVSSLGVPRRALQVKVEEVQAVLPAGSALIEFIRFDRYVTNSVEHEPYYGAVILAPSGDPVWVQLGPAEPIEKEIACFLHSVVEPADSAQIEGQLSHLFALVWQPVTRSLPPDVERVILSPDAELNQVPFAVLLDPAGRFLAETLGLSYVSSGRDLLTPRVAKFSLREVGILADPNFGETSRTLAASGQEPGMAPVTRASTVPALRHLRFDPLPGSRREAVRLADLARAHAVLAIDIRLGRDATEEWLRRGSSPSILHIATHGFSLADPAERRDRGVGPEQEGTSRRGATSPMLRIGIALAGARTTLSGWSRGVFADPANDGIATAEELAGLRLQDTWFVALSSCASGGGAAVPGEGVMGLRRAFIRTGARNLLLTSWPIEDVATADFMQEFYPALFRLRNAPRALEQVQRDKLIRLRNQLGVARACRLAGPFMINIQGRPDGP